MATVTAADPWNKGIVVVRSLAVCYSAIHGGVNNHMAVHVYDLTHIGVDRKRLL